MVARKYPTSFFATLVAAALITSLSSHHLAAQTPAPKSEKIFSRDNLVAWCIVPFDSKKRTPEQRARMLESLNLHKFAYDWRAEHLPTFEEELSALKRHHIELTALWFPADLNADARFLLQAIAKHKLTPQLWITMQAKDAA